MGYLRTKRLFVLSVVSAIILSAGIVRSHCQVPCGIYNDQGRFDMMFENIETIEKCNLSIRTLSQENPMNMNQIIRWVETKEAHADNNIEILSEYFLAQRIKPVENPDSREYGDYAALLSDVHQSIVLSMKTKQSTEDANSDSLRAVLKRFKQAYLAGVK